MQVLHIITVNGIGGAERQLVTLLSALRRTRVGLSCLIFYRTEYLSHASDIALQLKENGVDVTLHEYSTVLHPSTLNFLEAFIKGQKPDIIHTHLRHVEMWLAILKWRNKIRVPVVSTIHGYNDRFHGMHGMDFSKVNKVSAYYQATKFIGHQLDAFIAISKGIANLFTKAGLYDGEKISVVPHGTEINRIDLQTKQAVHPDLVIIGRLVRFKGHHFAIQAVQVLKAKYPGIKLHIYGTGPEEDALKTLVAKNHLSEDVLFNGFAENIQDVLPQHSIAIIPSIGEPFGIVFFDCFKAGLPVVAFDVAASNEIIDNGYNGLLAQAGNPVDLAQKIEMLLIDQELYQRIAANAIKALQEKFDIEKIAQQYIAVYQQALGKSSGSSTTNKLRAVS